MGHGMSGGGDEPAADGFWAAARRRYEDGRESVLAIAGEAGMTAQALTAKARALGWKLRRATPKSAGTRDTIARLKNLLQQRLTDLESQIGAIGEAASAATSERDIRAMNTLVRTLEKVLELERKERLQRSRQRKAQRHFDDVERDALAEKFMALHRELHPDAAEAPVEAAAAAPGAGAEP